MADIDLKELVEKFDEAAQSWGWERDQGTKNVQASLDEYERAKAALIARLEAADKEREGLAVQQWTALTDEDRQAAFESLPDMLEGFLKTWGWLHFAKEIERRCMEKSTPKEAK